MIRRIWHGWTTPGNAEAYEALLEGEIFPGILARNMPGYRGVTLLRRDGDDEVAFITIMAFDSLESVKRLVGDEPTRSYVPDKAKALLSRWDDHAEHYEVRQELRY